MRALTPLSLDDAQRLVAEYDNLLGAAVPQARIPAVRSVTPVLIGTVNSSYAVNVEGLPFFVRIYEEQDHAGARAEAERLELLAIQGVRTPPPKRRRDGAFVGTLGGKPVAVFPWRDGTSRRLSQVTPADARRVGIALAEVHRAGRDTHASAGRFELPDLLRRLDRLAGVPFPAIVREVEPLRAKLAHWTGRRDPSLPRGLIHGDVFRDNVLWDEQGEISALLDFESASFGVLAYDLMVTVLAWSFRDGLDLGIAGALVAGYESVRPLEAAEWAGLLAEGCAVALRFTITRLTDAELRAAELGVPARRDKDWRRFALRLATLEALGPEGLRQALGRSR